MDEINYDLLSIDELNIEVKKGNLNALFNISERYLSGKGVEQDIHKALEGFNIVYKESQDIDLKYCASSIMGEFYLNDEQNKNIDLGLKYLEEASEYGLPNALLYLGIYLTGIDDNFDRTEEQLQHGAKLLIELYERSKIESPDVTGGIAYYVAVLYAYGKGVNKDLLKAKEYVEYTLKRYEHKASEELLKYIKEELNKEV